eukprot:CAMPEP_0115556676 /NCGR_PEP_ID=MMETSP0271-20121206/98499_1 /TAXON_ID=71861 /ORGANISM="Scrippsiella trochoidea, Strain CCMP3099" /LENGTH=37 /DNA_ID= /DNA_START= /DNA_END= /DNA_ORIENTATION=
MAFDALLGTSAPFMAPCNGRGAGGASSAASSSSSSSS